MKKLLAALLAIGAVNANAFFFEAILAEAGSGYYSGEEMYRRGKDAFSIGYVTAVHDADLTSNPLDGMYCVPAGAKNGQLVDVAWLYLEQNPAKRHLHAAHLVRQSWRAAWPCPPKAAITK